jgi:zinc protease
MVTLATGVLPPEETVRDIARAFAFEQGTEPVHPLFLREAAPEAPRTTRLTMPLNVGYVALGFLGPAAADLRETIALDVVSLVLGEGMSSRMHQRLMEQLPNTPFFDAGSTHWTHRDSSTLLAYGIVRPDALPQAHDLLLTEIERLQQEPPSPAELWKAVTCLEAHFAAKAETAAGLTFAVADSFASVQSPAVYTEYLPILRSLTIDELQHLAGVYLASNRVCAVLLGPEK